MRDQRHVSEYALLSDCPAAPGSAVDETGAHADDGQCDHWYAGTRMPCVEDTRLLTGHGTFVDDIQRPGMLHACFVRSPFARATISAIDPSAALAMPGVVAVHRRRPQRRRQGGLARRHRQGRARYAAAPAGRR